MSRKTRQSPLRAANAVGHILLFGDLHGPYQHSEALDFLETQKQRWKPSRVVCLGDVADGLTASRYGVKSDAEGADAEHKKLETTLIDLAVIFPRLEVVEGNHDVRVEKKAAENGIPASRVRPLRECPNLVKPLAGWTWATKIEINADTIAIHGDGLGGANPGEAAVLQHRRNVVLGHLHTRAGAHWYARGQWRNWCLHLGCLIDPDSAAANYAAHHVKRPILGCGVLIDGKYPMFVPMN